MLLGGNRDHINKLFGFDVRYEVPRYQRRYVWNETNWSTLWEDILYQLGLDLVETEDGQFVIKQHEQSEDVSTVVSEDNDRGHFTGLIVTRPISKGMLERFEVIDGQQRLATFQIILCVIRDIFKLENCSDHATEAEQLIVNTSTVIERYVSERFSDTTTNKFIPTEYDKSAFQKVIGGEYGRIISEVFDETTNHLTPELVNNARSQIFEDSNNVSHSILDAYDYFYQWVRVYVGKVWNYIKLDELLSTIKTDFDFVRIDLDKSDQSEKIFESLNATGRMLSDFDFLRNNLFLRAGELGDTLYDEYWNFEKDKDASHYWNAGRLESFLRAFLVAHLGPDCLDAENVKLFDLYRTYSITLGGGIVNEFKRLSAYAKSYQELIDAMDNNSSPICRHMQFYSDRKLPSLDPFILFVKHTLGESGNLCALRVCGILESYLVRRMLCSQDQQDDSYRGINEASYARIKSFFSKSIKVGFSEREFIQYLSNPAVLSFESEAAVWPGDTQVQEALDQAKSKNFDFITYIFRRVEHWNRDQSALWRFSSFTVEEQVVYLQELYGDLEKILRTDPELPKGLDSFNNLWAPPESFLE